MRSRPAGSRAAAAPAGRALELALRAQTIEPGHPRPALRRRGGRKIGDTPTLDLLDRARCFKADRTSMTTKRIRYDDDVLFDLNERMFTII